MNTPIVPYIFEDYEVRIKLDDAGEPLFVAADILGVLSLDRKALERLDEDEKGVNSIHTLGGPQDMTVINESGLYSLILGSRKPEAKRFKKWVTKEVIPSIRKTGSYQTRPATVPALSPMQDAIGAAMLIMGSVPGVNPAIAAAAALTMIKEHTGIDTEPMRRCLPVAQGPTASLNPTRLAKLVGSGVTAQGINSALEYMGLQQKCLRGGWELTDAGRKYGEAMPFSRNGHAGYQVLWQESVVPELDNYFSEGEQV